MTQTASTVLAERYELRTRLFSEGNQAAYAARDRTRGEDVLLFLIPSASKLAEKVDAAVRADIEKAFRVEAPNLLPLLDLGDSGGYRYLTMPMPPGANAWTRITQKKGGTKLGPEEALAAGDGLIAAAKAAHAAGTILGFSPKQVWIDPRGQTDIQYYWLERVHLDAMDAADATASFRTLAAEGGYFQAPELGQGAAGAKPAADQFFIGAILYGLLTGEVPGGTLAPIRRTRADVPKPLAAGVEKALARDASKRHADLDAFRRALHRKPARVGYLAPFLLLLLALWASASVLMGGASIDDWQFPAETEARRQAAFEASKPTPQPVPRAVAATLARFAGRYESDGETGKLPPHELTLGRDGTFRLVDRSGADTRIVRGLYHAPDDEAAGIVLLPASAGDVNGRASRLRVHAAGLQLEEETGRAMVFRQVGWPQAGDVTFQPLVTLEGPLPGAVLDGTRIRLVGRVAVPETQVSLVGGAEVPVVGGRFDTVVEAPARGMFTVRVEARSPHGIKRTVTREVHIDTAPPQIEADASLAEASGIWALTVSGRVADDGDVVAVRVNDEPVPIDDEGRFRFVRKGADALQYAFAEIVAVDDAGRAGRRLVWPQAARVDGAGLAKAFEEVDLALEERETDEAEDLLRRIRASGGLIEQVAPERMTRLVHSDRAPRVSLDDHPHPPGYFPNDGTQEVTLSGRVDWLAPGDTLVIAGRQADIEDGRFTLRFPLPKLGPNTVALRVLRSGETVASRDVELWIAAEDGRVPDWTGVPVSEAQREASARHGLPLGIEDGHGQRFVLVPPGAFFRRTRAGRRFEVRVTKPYYLQIREVSRDVYERISGTKLPTMWKARGGDLPVGGADRPATGMTRAQALAFARKLAQGGDARYDLPTEAQWELAARAGVADQGSWYGGDPNRVPAIANFADASIRDILPGWPKSLLALGMRDDHAGTWSIDKGTPNAWGFRNLFGNAAEWVADYYAEYDPQESEDPVGPVDGTHGVVRGGSFRDKYDAWNFDVRGRTTVSDAVTSTGLRLVLIPRGR